MPAIELWIHRKVLAIGERGTLVEFAMTWLHDFWRAAFDTYRPEAHYMRGPGPACAAKTNRREP